MLVTHVQAVGPFLRIFGQLDLERMQQIQAAIDSTIHILNQIQQPAPKLNELPVDIICLARFMNKHFRRARIIGHWGPNEVFVQFIDYGNECNVKLQEIRLINFQTDEVDLLQTVPTQASPFILSRIYCQWNQPQINELNADLSGQYVTSINDAQLGDFVFITLIWRNQNLVDYLVHIKNMGKLINLEEQTSIFNTILTSSRGLVPVRQLQNVLQQTQYNMPQLNHSIPPSPVSIQTTLTNPVMPSPPVLRMPYRNTAILPRSDITSLPTPTRPRIDTSSLITSPPKRSVMAFKSNTLMVGKFYDVFCCFVENGPGLFSVQLNTNVNELNEMMNDIENIPSSNLTERPVIGMACIARFSEDSNLYRAVIMTIKPTACQVGYVDYGNTETVPFADLYEIQPNLLDQKIFAIRFALSGYKELEPIDEGLKNAFKDMVLHKDLRLKVMPLEGPPLVQYCELYDGKTNILEALKNYKNRKLSYLSPPPLCNNDVVVIRYVESPKKFFVQKVESTNAFDDMMDDLFLHCKKLHAPLQQIAKGAACAVKFENAWYRAEIVDIKDDRVHIRHVDFGNERKVDPTQLCMISEELVKFPIQATKCCLKGFENPESLSESATVQLEMLAENVNNERRHFKCHIYQIEKDGTVLVNLIDEKMRPELNLMKRLYKLSMPFNKYIGLEKEEYPLSENSQQMKPINDHISAHSVFNSTSFSNDDQRNANDISNEWNMKSTNSVHSDDAKELSNSSEYQNNRRQNRSPQSGRPFRENINRREQKDQPYQTFKGKNSDLPPRFQKQQDDNRRFKENRPIGTYDAKRSSYNSDNNYTTQSNAPQQSHIQPVQCDDEWDTDPKTAPVASVSTPSSFSTNTREEYVPLNYAYQRSDIPIPSREEILLCWWVSPHQFYTHNCKSANQFEILMREMQMFYKNKSRVGNVTIDIGSSVVARYQKDQVLYRSKILAYNESLRKYRVEFVDFGNQATVTADDIWLLEKRFSQFPIMANLCGFENIVSNFEHRQITSQVEKHLKPDLKLYCNYIRIENGLCYADIDVNGQSLRELLICDGCISIVESNLSVEMLSGQQIRVKIVNIKDLLNFQIEIESCDLRLMSSYNDIKFVKSNSHLSNEFKYNYEGKWCIADVIDVSKEKILMIQPIIPLFINHIPEKICQYPVVYREFNVKVAFIETENIIYAHPVAADPQLAELLDEMHDFYNSEGSALTNYAPGTFCAALSTDGNWYRAKIVFFDSSNYNAEVYYIDYGNIELIEDKNSLRVLEKKFYELSALAIRFIFPIKSNNTDETTVETIKTLTDGYELTLSILERYKTGWIADIQSNGNSLIDVLKDSYSLTNGIDIEHAKNLLDNDSSCMDIAPPELEVSVKSPLTESRPTTTNSSTTEILYSDSGMGISDKSDDLLEAATNNMIPAYLSHCDNPGRFFLHLTSTFAELQQLQDNIQIVAQSLPPLMIAVTGALCIALYTVDETWYRAKIIDGEIMAVQFIDYGNTDVVTDSSYVKEMNEAFANIPPFAVPCALPISPRKTADWVDEANNIFNEAYDKTVYFSYVTQNPKKNYVNLKIDGINVAEKLIAENLARKLEVLKSGENGFVSHINSLSDFYIQMESYADGLELIAGHLANFESFNVLTDNSIGNVCAAVFPEDNSWYRAKILAQVSEGTEVLFIDYGNTAITTELREISAEIANLPFLAKKCSLRMPDYILGWSDEAEAKLHELSAMGETVFVVELIEPSDHAIIDLFIGDKNILEDLEPLCDKRPNIDMDLNSSMGKDDFALHEHISEPKLDEATVVHVNSPNDFYIHLLSEKDKLDEVLDTLNSEVLGERLEHPQVGSICNAMFSDDGAYYRAEILSNEGDAGYNVLFIDYGNTAISNELYSLPDKLNTKTGLAYQCTLDSHGPLDLTSPAVMESFLQITTQSEVFKVDIIDRSTKPWIVSLQYDDINVYEELEKLMPQNLNNVDNATEITKRLDHVVVKEQKRAVLSHINSPSDFYVQLASEKDKLDQILETLNNGDLCAALEQPDDGMLCNALFNDDGAFYRARILSTEKDIGNRVIFVDYGNETIANEIYSLPTGLNTIHPLAYQCTLDTNNLQINSQLIIDKFLQITSELQDCEIDIEIINSSSIPWVVNFQYNGLDVHNELEKCEIDKKLAVDFVENIIENCLEEASGHTMVTDLVNEIIDESIPKELKSEDAYISYMNSPTDFYIHLLSEKDKLDQILDTLNSGEHLGTRVEKPEVGKIVNANFSDDGAFYRAKVLSHVENDDYSVLFIDYGNEAVTSELYSLPCHLNLVPPLAHNCTLHTEGSLDLREQSVIEDFLAVVTEYQNENLVFKVNFHNQLETPWTVSLESNGIDIYKKMQLKNSSITDELVSKEIVESIVEKAFEKDTILNDDKQFTKDLVSQIINDTLDMSELDDTVQFARDIVNSVVEKSLSVDETKQNNEANKETSLNVKVTQVYNTDDFYTRPCSAEQKSKMIEKRLEAASDFEQLKFPNIGDICVAFNPNDKSYHRVKIITAEVLGYFKVESIDSGVRMVTHDLRELTEDLRSIPALASHCRLHMNSATEDEIDQFITLTESNPEKQYQMVIKSTDDNINTVQLHSAGVDIQDELTAVCTVNGVIDATIDQILKDAVVSHVNTPNDFYIQLSCDMKNLESITAVLYEAINFDKVLEPEEGLLCAALFPDDGAFYRAQILSVHNNSSYDVRFIDFGNFATTDDIRILPDELRNKESIAKQCALENLHEIDLWSEQASEAFTSLITSHFGETLEVEIISSVRVPWIVRLFYGSKNLLDKLKKIIDEQQNINSNDSSDVWVEAKDSSGAIICCEIVDDLIDDLLISNGKQSTVYGTPSSTEDDGEKFVTGDILAQQLWDGLEKLGISGTQSMGNRASSTSNLSDTKLKNVDSTEPMLLERSDPTRSKSVECVIDSK